MSVTVADIKEIIQRLAPFDTAEAFDNVGLLVGKNNAPVSKILVALDVTLNVVEEAKRIGAELIISHHPLLFHARKNLVEEDAEAKILCELIRSHISLISAHTNLDRTEWSGSACCARMLKLQNLRQEGFLFLGELPAPVTPKELAAEAERQLQFPVRCYGAENKIISTLAIAGGAYDEGWAEAMQLGADALLTGEVRHHNALSAVMNDFVILDGGHWGTEAPLVTELCAYLQNEVNGVEWNVRVYPSLSAPFGGV